MSKHLNAHSFDLQPGPHPAPPFLTAIAVPPGLLVRLEALILRVQETQACDPRSARRLVEQSILSRGLAEVEKDVAAR